MNALDDGQGQDYNVNMAQVSVELSPELQRHVDARAAAGDFGDAANYLRALAQQDEAAHKADVARVQALIDEGLASGVCDKDAFEVLDEIIAGVRQPHG